MSCGPAHSSARELVAQGNEAKLVAETLAISRSSLYYRRQPRPSRADRSRDQEIVMACGEKPAYASYVAGSTPFGPLSAKKSWFTSGAQLGRPVRKATRRR